jgi:trehalose 6-phosphate synthase/phosphatase
VHDYHLFRAPALLRARLPEARIGFFLHVPFPSPDIFAALPRRRWLLEGLLGADVIGFHTRRYRAHFEEVLAERCGIETGDDHVLEHEGRRIQVGVFPIGVDADALSRRAGSREVNAKVLELRDPTQRLILGVDRLDYSKGIPRRLLAVEKLLRERPEWRGRLRLVQVAVPSRGGVGAYQRFRREVESLVGRINGEFATPTWTPIHYLCHGVPERMLLGLYRTADVMLVTPVRDGMNLVAKEFAASRIDEDGVLVLSELAGAADELTDALLVNPYDVEAVAQTIHRALTMDGVERRTRMRRLRAQVRGHDIHRWAAEFIGALSGRPAEL